MTGIPMTLAQQGIWFTERVGGASTAYTLAVSVTVKGPASLDEAWAAVTRRHPVLASTVVETDGVPLLVPTEPAPVRHREVGAAALAPVIAAEIGAGFDLTAGPLARCAALRTDDGRTVALVVAHHLVFDGGGKDVLVADLTKAIAGQALGAGSPAALAASVQAQADRIAEALPAARGFWSRRPAPPAEVILPGLSSTPTAAEPATQLDIEWSEELDAALTAGASTLGATRFELLLAGLHAVLARYGNAISSVAVGLSTRPPRPARGGARWGHALPRLPG
ncbi:hypothetical protein K1W54_06320, partial [Micromonospora sp. CPCC 205371]|nr:hypothetical protein [Micromonospora sp. CPCC 205371]